LSLAQANAIDRLLVELDRKAHKFQSRSSLLLGRRSKSLLLHRIHLILIAQLVVSACCSWVSSSLSCVRTAQACSFMSSHQSSAVPIIAHTPFYLSSNPTTWPSIRRSKMQNFLLSLLIGLSAHMLLLCPASAFSAPCSSSVVHDKTSVRGVKLQIDSHFAITATYIYSQLLFHGAKGNLSVLG
jgi:hypothetical protein